MARLKALALTGAAVLALSRVALAADLLPPAPMLEPMPPAASPEFSGWYLRGDIGMAFNATTPNLVNTPDPLASSFYSALAFQAFSNSTISASGLVDVGVGYQVNSWFRGDVTLEFRDGGNFQSLYTLNDPVAGSQLADFYRGNVSSVVGMVNAYADLGTWYGMTPFVGAGVGISHNTLSGLTDQGQAYTPTFGGPSGGYFSPGSTNNFAWALMAGVDFNVTPNLKLELGYRYLNLGKISSGGSNCLSGSGSSIFTVANCGGVQNYISSTNTLASNDFRIGLRWMIGEAVPPPPPVLVRKY